MTTRHWFRCWALRWFFGSSSGSKVSPQRSHWKQRQCDRGMTTRPSPSHLLEVIVIISSWYKILDGRNLYSECAWWAAMSDGSRLLELMRCGPAIPRERERWFTFHPPLLETATHTFQFDKFPWNQCVLIYYCALECEVKTVPYFEQDQHSHKTYIIQFNVFHAWKLLTQITLPLQQVDTLIMTGCV